MTDDRWIAKIGERIEATRTLHGLVCELDRYVKTPDERPHFRYGYSDKEAAEIRAIHMRSLRRQIADAAKEAGFDVPAEYK